MRLLEEYLPARAADPVDAAIAKLQTDVAEATKKAAAAEARANDAEQRLTQAVAAQTMDLSEDIDALRQAVNQTPTASTWLEPVLEYPPAPSPVIVATGGTLGTDLGTRLVNQGKIHTVTRTTGIIPPAFQVAIAAPFALLTGGNLTFRCAVPVTMSGSISVQLDTATPLTATGNGTAWTSTSAGMVVRTDNGWAWFEVDIPQRSDAGTTITVTMPVGTVQLPCLYYPPVQTTIAPPTLVGMKLIDPKSAQSMVYKPSEFAKPADIVPVRSRLGMMPNPNWIVTPSDLANWYIRPYTGKLTSLSFEYQDRDNPAVGTFTLTDFTTGFTARDSTQSAYFGHPSRFFDVTPSGGVAMRIAIGLNPVDALIVYAMRPTGAGIPGKIRKVMINGEAVDWMPVGDRINETNATQDTAIAYNVKSRTYSLAPNGTAIDVGGFIKCQFPSSGNRSLQFATKTGSLIWNGVNSFFGSGLSTSTNISDTTMTTTFTYTAPVANLANANDRHLVIINDTTNGQKWMVTAIAGNTNHLFLIDQL